MATKKKKKVGFAMMEPKDDADQNADQNTDQNANEEDDASQFKHTHSKTAHALEVTYTKHKHKQLTNHKID